MTYALKCEYESMSIEDAIDQLTLAIELIKQDGIDWLDERDIPILEMAIKALSSYANKKVINRNDITKVLNTMDRYVSEELRLCDTEKKFPENEVFIVDDVYEEIDNIKTEL